MSRTPVLDNLLISSSFVRSGIDVFSFCRPSLGPTSTTRTSPARRLLVVVMHLRPSQREAARSSFAADFIGSSLI